MNGKMITERGAAPNPRYARLGELFVRAGNKGKNRSSGGAEGLPDLVNILRQNGCQAGRTLRRLSGRPET
jgi:hypothetical protein